MEPAIALARLGQFAGAMVLCGSSLFFLYGQPQGVKIPWGRALLVLAGLLGALATLGWLMAEAALFSDAPAEAFKPAAVWAVAADTGFGRMASLRLLLFILALAVLGLAPPARRFAATGLLGAAATASFAWTGHGAMTEGAGGPLHLSADILHSLAAAMWIGALLPLAVLTLRSRRSTARPDLEAARLGLERFSGLGPAVVAVLIATGLVNAWFLVGPSHLLDLAATPYGRLLLLKLVLFGLMLGLAAINRLVFTPGLASALADQEARALPHDALAMSVLAETVLALAVMTTVGWLGALEPPGGG